MRAIKWTLIGVGAVVVLLAGTVFVITSLIDPNRYRGRVEKEVTGRVGRPFVIDGKMEVMWYPWLGVRLGRAHLEDQRGDSGTPMIEWESVFVAAKVVPLLRGQLVVDRVRLQSPHVRLRRDARGHGNWEDLGRRSSGLGAVMASEQEATARATGAPASTRAPGRTTAGASASTTAPGEKTPGPSAPTAAPGEKTPGPSAPTTVSGEKTPVPSAPTTVSGEKTPGPSAPAAVSREKTRGVGPSIGAPTAAEAGQSRVTGVTEGLQVAGIEVRDGVLDYVDEATGLKINLSKLDFDMSEWRTGQSLSVHSRFLLHGESLPTKGLWIEVETRALDVRAEPLSVSTPKAQIKIADAVIEGSFSYEQTAEGLVNAHGSIAAQAPSLRKLAADLALNQTMPHDPTTLGLLELKTQWSYANGALAAKPLAVKLDGVNFEGWVKRGGPPRSGWQFELHGDRINLDRYVNVDSTSTKPFELEMLRDIDANGSLVFDEALLAEARLSGVRLRVETKQ